jgi:hypothetical protein
MPIAQWPLSQGRPVIQVVLTFAVSGQKVTRTLLADTGAGHTQSRFDLLLVINDCLMCGGIPAHSVPLGGAYTGLHQVNVVPVEISLLGFHDDVLAVGIARPPVALDGIAAFRFVNGFTYGKFGNPGEFGLET